MEGLPYPSLSKVTKVSHKILVRRTPKAVKLIRIERDPTLRAPGMKFYVRTHRVHHGFTGMVFTAIGLTLAIHDRRDWRRWLKDLVREL